MGNPHYCSTGWGLYDNLIETFFDFEAGKDVPPELFDKNKYAACLAELNGHFETCTQCSLEESRFEKKRATPVR